MFSVLFQSSLTPPSVTTLTDDPFALCISLKSESEVAQSCPTLCDPMDSLPGSSVHGIFQARVLECVAISFSNLKLWAVLALRLLGCTQGTRPVGGEQSSLTP